MDYNKLIKGCYFPYVPKDDPQAKFACGKCPNCLKRRVDMWTFRISYHMRFVDSIYFVTFTYADGTITRSKNGFLSLDKSHFRNYMKRVRKEINQDKDTPFNKKIKYVVTGEYGGIRKRPHYHALIMNVPFDVIEKHWHYGHVDIKEVNRNRIAYMFKYIQKARGFKLMHGRDDRVPEYVNFSQGIGKQWLTKENIDFHRRNIDNPTLLLPTGERIAIPRYFKERIFNEEQRQYIAEMMKDYADDVFLTDEQHQKLLLYKKEKIRLMNKNAKKEKVQ